MSSEGAAILHRPDQRMFLIRLAPGTYSFLQYEIKEGKFYVNKTYTPPEYRGKGLATKLLQHAVAWARENGFKIVPVCSFAVEYFRRHPELRDELAEEGLQALNLTQ